MESKLTTDKSGNKVWKLPNGDKHREDGPALETKSGSKHWFLDDKRHREDGPAREYPGGYKEWFLDDVKFTEQEHKYEIRSRKLKLLLENS